MFRARQEVQDRLAMERKEVEEEQRASVAQVGVGGKQVGRKLSSPIQRGFGGRIDHGMAQTNLSLPYMTCTTNLCNHRLSKVWLSCMNKCQEQNISLCWTIFIIDLLTPYLEVERRCGPAAGRSLWQRLGREREELGDRQVGAGGLIGFKADWIQS